MSIRINPNERPNWDYMDPKTSPMPQTYSPDSNVGDVLGQRVEVLPLLDETDGFVRRPDGHLKSTGAAPTVGAVAANMLVDAPVTKGTLYYGRTVKPGRHTLHYRAQ